MTIGNRHTHVVNTIFRFRAPVGRSNIHTAENDHGDGEDFLVLGRGRNVAEPDTGDTRRRVVECRQVVSVSVSVSNGLLFHRLVDLDLHADGSVSHPR